MGKVYPEELKKKAVELYRLDEQTTYAEVGRDLVIGATVGRYPFGVELFHLLLPAGSSRRTPAQIGRTQNQRPMVG